MKAICWNCRGVGNPSTIHELKQLLVANVPDVVFLYETKIQSNCLSRISSMCRMEGCLAVSAEGKSGGLALMWRERVKVTIQNYAKYHVDSLISLDDGGVLRFTGFYGQADPNLRKQSWDMLRRVKSTVREGWIVVGDFNAILNDAEKEGGRRKPKNSMDEFSELLEELALSNNREGPDLVKERLDRFLVSEDVIEKMPFLDTKVVRQSKSDHDVVLINTIESKPGKRCGDPKPWFRYDTC
ncbi:reverse transcriptase [Gossypium australe]|uniref:Reverse transcriptase n=1 Tax=Gossypium australe TaxID=47621 RepID=A0A5B6WJM9_9ROSI|nr:reverse transcriptase [Gossypium australe]